MMYAPYRPHSTHTGSPGTGHLWHLLKDRTGLSSPLSDSNDVTGIRLIMGLTIPSTPTAFRCCGNGYFSRFSFLASKVFYNHFLVRGQCTFSWRLFPPSLLRRPSHSSRYKHHSYTVMESVPFSAHQPRGVFVIILRSFLAHGWTCRRLYASSLPWEKSGK